ncbi:HAD-like domain-containing protein [Xylaria scruposa]|nr:HAD-like domain-containing protein [Xylaria scruposa]
MQVRLEFVFMRRFLRSNNSRIHSGRLSGLRCIHNNSNNNNNNHNCADSKRPRPAKATSDTISIMSAGGSAGYAGYALPIGTGYDGYAGYASGFSQNTILSHAFTMTQNSPIPPASRQVRSRSPKANKPRDKITQPSPESGGVPDPTPEYLEVASHPPFLLPQPRNILVVVDLNGTLLHRPNRHSPTRFVERPYARSFLSYCINTFTVVVWSSARYQNVSNMCKQLLTPEDSAKVVAVWSRDNFGLSKGDFDQRVQCYKRLTALWNDPVVAASHPMAESGEKWSQLNTVLVDDSIEKARSEPFNLVQIPDFQGDAKEPGFVLPQVHDYLNKCSQQANISAYMKGQPFKIQPQFTL